MKKLTFLCATMLCHFAANSQTLIEKFEVGPYNVEYHGEDDVRYRLKENVDLYEYFELKRDTVVVVEKVVEKCKKPHVSDLRQAPVYAYEPVNSAYQAHLIVGTGFTTSKEIGIGGAWKKGFATDWRFNVGLDLNIVHVLKNRLVKNQYTTMEFALPLQVEYGKLNRGESSFYALAGVIPTLYTALRADNVKKETGFTIAPEIEAGANIPVGNKFIRIGAFGMYKFNNDGFYRYYMGRAYMGGKVGFIF